MLCVTASHFGLQSISPFVCVSTKKEKGKYIDRKTWLKSYKETTLHVSESLDRLGPEIYSKVS